MFKRLSKSRRHSADDVALSLSCSPQEQPASEPPSTPPATPATPATPPATTTTGTRENAQGLRASWSKHSRRSCGDATSVQAFLPQKQDRAQNETHDADYQMVTAVPAFIVEHEPDKQRGSSFGVWSRRMSKKIDSFRRSGSRETICPASERIDLTNSLNKSYTNNDVVISNNNNINNNNKNLSVKPSGMPFEPKTEEKVDRRFSGVSQRSPSPFKSFFIRMGSTGMLNSARINRRSQNIDERLKSPDKENLFRSCSTSQLNTSPTYVKGDDPSEGIDLQIASRKDKTVSCDDLAATVHRDDVFDAPTCDVSPSVQDSGSSFHPCDFAGSRVESSAMRKSNSCEFKETKKSSFPYAFLRSKLSVLPEERHGPFPKDERLFKTASEEHFPALKIEDSYNGTTTLGRRRVRNANVLGVRCQEASGAAKSRTPPAELRRMANSCDQDVYSSGQLESREDTGCYSPFDSSPMSLRGANVLRPIDGSHERMDLSGRNHEFRLGETTSLSMELEAMASLRSQRRNSAPSGEQRLSSHYVSSNESGYDSDGPRGESVGPSENDGLKCTTDSSDTSSVVDSEIEKPIRSSTPSEDSTSHQRANRELTDSDGIDGLRWHQSNSGRLLPSIHQTSFDESPALDFSGRANTPVSTEGDNVGKFASAKKALDSSAPPPLHRARLQQDKSRFLNDIVQPPKRVRRCRLVQLHKRDPKENLGIRLAQQRAAELRYIVVQLEPDGIAHRDGRLRLGDEIVEVEGKELRSLESLEEVQDFLKSFAGNRIRLMTAYEEAVPLVYVSPNSKNSKNRNNSGNSSSSPAEHEYLENARNLSNMSLIDNPTAAAKRTSPIEQQPLAKEIIEDRAATEQANKRPDFLPLSCLAKDRRSADNSFESESQHYLTKHVTRFEKGYGKPSLGFSVVGGRDSPRGEMGIFVRRVFPGGQADVSKLLQQGDEILSLNGKVLRGHTHQEVIELFKAVREGPIELEIARRHRYPRSALKSAPC